MSFVIATDQIACIIIESLINSFWQGILLIIMASLTLFIFRKLNAATRYLILWLTLLILVFMPFLNILLINESINFMPFADQNSMVSIEQENAISSFDNIEEKSIPSLLRLKSINIPIPMQMLPSLILGLWSLVTVFMLSRLLRSLFYINKLKRNLLEFSPEYQQKIMEFLNSTGIKQKIAICATNKAEMPMAIGLFNPVILIPDNLMNKLTDEQLKQVILHELAHIKRLDNWTNMVQKIIETFYFWHPMVLFLGRRLNIEREIACDDWVITLFGESKSYALCLTKLIELKVMSGQTIATGAALYKKHIARRIMMLLNKGRNTTTRFSRGGIMVVIFSMILAFTVFTSVSPFITLVGWQEDNPEPILKAENITVSKHIAKQEPKLNLPSRIKQGVEDSFSDMGGSIETIQPKTALLKNSINEEPIEIHVKTGDTPIDIDKPARDIVDSSLFAIKNKRRNFSSGSGYTLEDIKAPSQNIVSQQTDKKQKVQLTASSALEWIGKSAKDIIPNPINVGVNKNSKYKLSHNSKTALLNLEDGRINLAVPTIYSQPDSNSRRILTRKLDLVKMAF